jgi:SRSO17 transposase
MELKEREVENEFNNLMNRLAPVFFSEKGFINAKNYIRGLLGSAERKNSWQMAEYLCEATPYKIQHFLYRGGFSADELRDKGRDYIEENLGSEEGVLVVDDTGFIKQGKKSCGVKRQYTGTAGKIENCQIGVFLTYASEKGHAPIDRRLYMPEEWIEDKERRTGAGVPEELKFQTKPQMGLEMIQEATAAGVRYKWVTGDCAYGDYREIRQWLEKNEKCYVMCVSGKEYIWEGCGQIKVGNVIKKLCDDNWVEASSGNGSKGARIYEWQGFEIESYGRCEGWKRVMLVRRSKTEPKDIRAHICYAPKGTSNEKLIEVAGKRWTVESCFKESKGEVGLDEYEVRSYAGWYKHITFACIALGFLTVLSANALEGKKIQEYNAGTSSLEEFKKKRNLRV